MIGNRSDFLSDLLLRKRVNHRFMMVHPNKKVCRLLEGAGTVHTVNVGEVWMHQLVRKASQSIQIDSHFLDVHPFGETLNVGRQVDSVPITVPVFRIEQAEPHLGFLTALLDAAGWPKSSHGHLPHRRRRLIPNCRLGRNPLLHSWSGRPVGEPPSMVQALRLFPERRQRDDPKLQVQGERAYDWLNGCVSYACVRECQRSF